MKPYPEWVCYDCGIAASKGAAHSVSTYHTGKCDVCGQEKPITQPRDFYYPKFEGHDRS